MNPTTMTTIKPGKNLAKLEIEPTTPGYKTLDLTGSGTNLWPCLTLSQTTCFRFFQDERVCRQQFKFVENGRNFSKRVENNVGKGEIAHY